MYCPFCGGANPDDGAFCAHCGQPLRPGAQQPPVEPPAEAPVAPALAEPPTLQAPPPVPGQPAAGQEPGGAYTCLVCGYILGPVDTVCTQCKTPRGMQVNPESAIPGAYTRAGEWQFVNTSGQQGDVPAEIRGGWNWGAFWFSWIWGVNHKVYVTFLTLPIFFLRFVPKVGTLFALGGLGCRIWFGIKGNEWAWQYRRFESVEQFRRVQRIWAFWVLGVFLGGIVIVTLLVAIVVALGISLAARNPGAFR